jgi:hypothetical protein
MKIELHLWVGAAAIGLPALALAQPTPAPAGTHVPPAFAAYQPYEDVSAGDWRALNEIVGQAAAKGGAHAGHGAASAAAAAPKMPASAPAAAPTGHDAHGGAK